jgi:hypothetical protein
MSNFNFAVNDSSTDTETPADDAEAVRTPDFESNEVGDLYLSFGDWKATIGEIVEALDLDTLKIYSDDTLEDASRLLGEYSEEHPMAKLHMVASLAKSTAGKMQRDNDHSIGLSNGKAPEEHFEESCSYALHSKDLPTITWEDLDGEEREGLEDMDIDPSTLGFDTTYGGPKLLSVKGNRLPIVVEEGDEIMKALEILQQLPDEPSAWTEDGLRESSHPEVFADVESDKVAEEQSNDNDDEVFNLAENPERVSEVKVSDLRGDGPDEFSVTNITSLRSINTMLRVEQENKNRSSAVSRLKERRNALQGSSDDDEEVGEEAEEQTEEETDDGEESEWTEADKNLMSTLVSSGQAESLDDAKEQIRSL